MPFPDLPQNTLFLFRFFLVWTSMAVALKFDQSGEPSDTGEFCLFVSRMVDDAVPQFISQATQFLHQLMWQVNQPKTLMSNVSAVHKSTVLSDMEELLKLSPEITSLFRCAWVVLVNDCSNPKQHSQDFDNSLHLNSNDPCFSRITLQNLVLLMKEMKPCHELLCGSNLPFPHDKCSQSVNLLQMTAHMILQNESKIQKATTQSIKFCDLEEDLQHALDPFHDSGPTGFVPTVFFLKIDGSPPTAFVLQVGCLGTQHSFWEIARCAFGSQLWTAEIGSPFQHKLSTKEEGQKLHRICRNFF